MVLIVILAVILAAFLWLRPHVDPRLAGRWECVDPIAGRQFVTLYLRSDGRGHYTWQEDGDAHVVAYPWAVSGSRLQVNFKLPDDVGLIDYLALSFRRWQVSREFESWKLLIVRSDELRLRQSSNSVELTFRRIRSGLDL